MCWCYCGRECAPHVAAAECTTALSHAPSRRPPTLITAAPSMAHPTRRVMPNGPVGRKLQQFKCMSRAMHLPIYARSWPSMSHQRPPYA